MEEPKTMTKEQLRLARALIKAGAKQKIRALLEVNRRALAQNKVG